VPLTFRLSTENKPASAQAAGTTSASHALGMEWIPEFMTEPLPDLVPTASSDGQRLTEVNFPPSGRAGAVTLYTSQRDLDGARGAQADYGLNHAVSTPTEILELELLVPEGLSDPQTVRANVFGRRSDPARAIELRTVDLLPQREVAIFLGALDRLPALGSVPRHHEAVEHVLGKLGWLGMRFDVYRCSVPFPIMHTTISLSVNGVA
jgi:hypothetical protein